MPKMEKNCSETEYDMYLVSIMKQKKIKPDEKQELGTTYLSWSSLLS